MKVVVAWMVTHDKVKLEACEVRRGVSLGEFIDVLSQNGKMPSKYAVSVYGEKKSMAYILYPKDRVEICLPLLDDPLLRRRARVKNTKRKVR